MNTFIVPAQGGVFVARGDEETFKPMTAVAMMALAERLLIAARDTLRAEEEARAPVDAYAPPATFAEAVHALR